MEESISSSPNDPLLQHLTSKGWCFADFDQVESIAALHSSASLESELCNLDLRSVGGKSLPDPSFLHRKSPNLRVPIVLQVASVKDVSRSSFATGASNRRLLKLILTDGHTELTAIEYSYIPSLRDDIVPGTKIRLEKKPVIHSGILCLVPGVITVLGGVVQTLYEEWEMNQKYLGFSRSSVKPARENEADGPPPFEKLQIGKSKLSFSKNDSRDDGSKGVEAGAGSGTEQKLKQHIHDARADKKDSNLKGVSTSQGIEEKPSTSQSRPKEGLVSSELLKQRKAQGKTSTPVPRKIVIKRPRPSPSTSEDKTGFRQLATVGTVAQASAVDDADATHNKRSKKKHNRAETQLDERVIKLPSRPDMGKTVAKGLPVHMGPFCFDETTILPSPLVRRPEGIDNALTEAFAARSPTYKDMAQTFISENYCVQERQWMDQLPANHLGVQTCKYMEMARLGLSSLVKYCAQLEEAQRRQERNGLSTGDIQRIKDERDKALRTAQQAQDVQESALKEAQRAKELLSEKETQMHEISLKLEETAQKLEETTRQIQNAAIAHEETVKAKDNAYLSLQKEKEEMRETFLNSEEYFNTLGDQIIPHWKQGVRIGVRQAVAKYSNLDPSIEYFEPDYDDYCGESDVEDSTNDDIENPENDRAEDP